MILGVFSILNDPMVLDVSSRRTQDLRISVLSKHPVEDSSGTRHPIQGGNPDFSDVSKLRDHGIQTTHAGNFLVESGRDFTLKISAWKQQLSCPSQFRGPEDKNSSSFEGILCVFIYVRIEELFRLRISDLRPSFETQQNALREVWLAQQLK